MGLNEYEARAYKALLTGGKSSAVAVSKSADIPRARVYDVLFSLEKKGFASRALSKPVRFSALRPLKAVESLARARRQELDSAIAEISAVAQSLERSSPKRQQGQQEQQESAMLIEGRNSIYALVGERLENCSDSVIISSSEEGLRHKKEFFYSHLRELAKKGVKVALVPSRELRCLVFDRNSVLFFLNDGNRGEGQEKALLVESPFVANYFHTTIMH